MIVQFIWAKDARHSCFCHPSQWHFVAHWTIVTCWLKLHRLIDFEWITRKLSHYTSHKKRQIHLDCFAYAWIKKSSFVSWNGNVGYTFIFSKNNTFKKQETYIEWNDKNMVERTQSYKIGMSNTICKNSLLTN
jgi:hypothetical protein